MDPQSVSPKADVASMAYTNCNTQIINLKNLGLPKTGTEDQYKELYNQISQTKTKEAALLTDAVNSVRYGIAPPVAFPTETVYGLGADATNKASIAGIFAAKGRPNDNPLIVHFASRDQLERITGEPLPDIYENLVRDFWPGPLTILVPVPRDSTFAENVHPGQKTIGVRVPQSKYARFFIAATDRPIAAPSANSSGKPSPTTAQHVMDDLKGKINFILDGGSCDVGVESTVVDGLCDPPLILRPGGVSQDELIAHGKRHGNRWAQTAIGYNQSHSSQQHVTNSTTENLDTTAPRAPGMKYKHYSPRGMLILFETGQSCDRLRSEIDKLIDDRPLTPSPTGNVCNDSKAAKEEKQAELCMAILTSTRWQPFTDLSSHSTAEFKRALESSIQTPDNSQLNGHDQVKKIEDAPPPSQHRQNTTTQNTQIEHSTTTYRNTKIHTINLGQTPRQIAQSLFAALRKCDDLGCTHILAEAPIKPSSTNFTMPLQMDDINANSVDNDAIAVDEGNGSLEEKEKASMDHAYDAVVERMRKAATLIL